MWLPLALLVLPVSLAAAPIEMALTYDDLPGAPQDLGRIAQALVHHRAPAVYGFVNGVQLDTDTSGQGRHALEAWRRAGFLLGNHTYSHANLATLSNADYLADVDRNAPLLASLGGPWQIFRFPYLREGFNLSQRRALRAGLSQRGYRIAETTVDTYDWSWDTAYSRCMQQGNTARAGKVRSAFLAETQAQLAWSVAAAQQLWQRPIRHIALAHSRALSADMAEALLTAYEAAGVRFIDLPTALADPIYALDPALPVNGATFLQQLIKARHLDLPDLPHDLAQIRAICPEPPVVGSAPPGPSGLILAPPGS